VLVGLEARRRVHAMRGCEFRVRLQALLPQHALLRRSAMSPRTRQPLRLDAQVAGECALEVPTSLALVLMHHRVALTAEVLEVAEARSTRARCEWPEQDLFTANLAPYTVSTPARKTVSGPRTPRRACRARSPTASS